MERKTRKWSQGIKDRTPTNVTVNMYNKDDFALYLMRLEQVVKAYQQNLVIGIIKAI